jgi:hypothetical protein
MRLGYGFEADNVVIVGLLAEFVGSCLRYGEDSAGRVVVGDRWSGR